jgi:hypothetical protein
LLLSLGVAGCGGAGESNLLQPGRDSGFDTGMEDVRSPDVIQAHDVVTMPDVALKDVTPPMDTTPPPVDTGPPDTGPKLPPVFCGASPCDIPGEQCCVSSDTPATYTCQPAGDYKTCIGAGSTPVFCDEAADCPGQICCGTKTSAYGTYYAVSCETTCESTNNTKIVFCNPAVTPDSCIPFSLTCKPSTILIGLSVCN